MKRYIYYALTLFALSGTVACSDFLDTKSDSIFTNDEVFSDETMIKSVLAGFYSSINWGQSFSSYSDFGQTDEACYSESVDNSTSFSTTLWRVYPYELIRRMNQFLEGVRETTVLSDSQKEQYEGEIRFLRAWAYFNMVRGLGGMPIVGDKIYEYDPSTDVTDMQEPRATEAATYDYIISECEYAAEHLGSNPSDNSGAARANKWVALSLKARAAIYAGSLAKYNNLVTPQVSLEGGEVGIPAERAEGYYRQALEASKQIIESKNYELYDKESDKSTNFYKALTDTKDNQEVIWAYNYKYPSLVHSWSVDNCPGVLTSSGSANRVVPLLNLVESFEYLDDRDGSLKYADASGNPIFYDNPGDLFANKDPRLRGTIICPGDVFANTTIEYQAGQMYKQSNRWRYRTGAAGSYDVDGDLLTSINGPQQSTGWFTNKTGFNFRKYLDENEEGRSSSHGSEIWYVRFRLAEIILIASEASLELGQTQDALGYINQIRTRAGIPSLTDMTILDIEQERRVELALENHRYWDLKRWRRAHVVWDGASYNSRHYTLFPYKVKDARSASVNGKWAFIRGTSSMMTQSREFQLKNYYNFLDDTWLSNNPKLVKNPYQ